MIHEISLWRWAATRLAFALPVIAGVTTLTFILIHLAPGDPIIVLAGDGGSPAYYDEMRTKYGLDRSVAEQFVRYVGAIAVGDLGYSFMFQAPVLRLLLDHVAASLVLGFAAMILGTAGGFAAGVLWAVTRSRSIAGLVSGGASLAYAAPVFWSGQVFILIGAVTLGWLPVGGLSTARESLTGAAWVVDAAWHLLLPAFTLSLPLAAVVARVTRAAVVEGMTDTYVRALYARGLTRARVIGRHVIPNSVAPVVALVGQYAAEIVAGAALTEALFAWPGIGYLVLHASLHRDYPLVTAAFIFISSGVVFFNALTDALLAWLDPRVRLT